MCHYNIKFIAKSRHTRVVYEYGPMGLEGFILCDLIGRYKLPASFHAWTNPWFVGKVIITVLFVWSSIIDDDPFTCWLAEQNVVYRD